MNTVNTKFSFVEVWFTDQATISFIIFWDSFFITKKWIEFCEQSEKKYNPNKEIRIKTSRLRSDLCDFSDAYVIVKRDITLGDNNANKRNKNAHHLKIVEQQSVTLLLTMQILLILQCLCTI